MTDFTRDWIAKREQLEQAATEGPWSAADEHGDIPGSDCLWCVSQMRPGFEAMSPTKGYVGDVAEVGDSEADAEFIADARTALPAALAALKAVLDIERVPVNRGQVQTYDEGWLDGYNDARREFHAAIESALRGES